MNHGLDFFKINDGELRELALFAGAGGGILGGILCGFRTVCAVEIQPFPRSVLQSRQNDGCLKPFPIWDNIKTFDGKRWRGCVDVVSGGFPCQDISAIGPGGGISGAKSGLWKEMARVIAEVQPRFAIIENSPMLKIRGLDVVLRDLNEMGFNASWGVMGVRQYGADHFRERIWIVATNANLPQLTGGLPRMGIQKGHDDDSSPNWWKGKSGMGRISNGVANWVDRIKAIGNGQIPAVVELAWKILK